VQRHVAMNEIAKQLRERVKRFAVRILKFVKTLPNDPATATVARQLARAGSGSSSNYHAACRARSRAEFIAKLGTVVEEADEAEHWLDVLKDSELAAGAELDWLRVEAGELRAIFKASLDTARANAERLNNPKASRPKRSIRESQNPEILKFKSHYGFVAMYLIVPSISPRSDKSISPAGKLFFEKM
jgi:four helix bundle protein